MGVLYLLAIVICNYGFSVLPVIYGIPPMTFLVGGVFILRDLAQRKLGHRVIFYMLGGLALSFFMADPKIALASTAAFAVSEGIDWLIYTRMHDYSIRSRILVSSTLAVPVDSALFMGLAGFLTPEGFAIMVLAKLTTILAVWIWMK